MTTEALAYIVRGGKTWCDAVYLTERAAEESAKKRKDGSVVCALSDKATADDLLAACKALLAMRDRGPKPKKLDDALTWRENDDKALAMAQAAIANAERAP